MAYAYTEDPTRPKAPVAPGMPGSRVQFPTRPNTPAAPPKPNMPAGVMTNVANQGPGPTPGAPPAPPTPAPPTPAAPPAPATPTATGYVPPTNVDSDDSPDALKMPSDPYVAEVRSLGMHKSEDYRRFSDAEILAWKPYYIGNGKYKNKWGDIVDKPDERGPNTPPDYNGLGDYVPGGFGGGGGGKGKGDVGVKGPIGMDTPESQEIWNAILARLKGGTRYTPEATAGFLSEVKNTAEAQAGMQAEEATAAAAASGMARSPALTRQLAAIRANQYSQVLTAKNQLMKAKIDADYQDKTAAIQQGLDWLNSLRTYTANMAATAAQKQAAMANIDLAYARMNQEQQMMREQYAQQLALMGLR